MFEHRGQVSAVEPVIVTLRPMADIGLYLAEMIALRDTPSRVTDWLNANAGFRQRVLDQLRESGPLQSKEIPDTSEVSWQSTGWTNDQNVTQLLQFLSSRGEVAVAGRRGRQRLWDVAERVYPADVEVVAVDEAQWVRDERLLRSLGIARPQFVGDAGMPVEVEGSAGWWRMDPAAAVDDFVGRTALLSPFDRLIHDRDRAREVFEFEYTLEMYKPAAQRRWGYFALPILHGDELVGKLDAVVDRRRNVLSVNAIHLDAGHSAELTAVVFDQVAALAEWLGSQWEIV